MILHETLDAYRPMDTIVPVALMECIRVHISALTDLTATADDVWTAWQESSAALSACVLVILKAGEGLPMVERRILPHLHCLLGASPIAHLLPPQTQLTTSEPPGRDDLLVLEAPYNRPLTVVGPIVPVSIRRQRPGHASASDAFEDAGQLLAEPHDIRSWHDVSAEPTTTTAWPAAAHSQAGADSVEQQQDAASAALDFNWSFIEGDFDFLWNGWGDAGPVPVIDWTAFDTRFGTG